MSDALSMAPGPHSAAELEALLHNAPLGVAYFDREHRYLRINDALAAINGVLPADHLGRRIEDLLPGPAIHVCPFLDQVFATGEAIGNIEVEGETPREPGIQRCWLTGFFPVRDGGGAVASVGIWVTETTAMRSADAALLANERQQRALLESVPVHIWTATPDGAVGYSSPWMSNYTGVDAPALRGAAWLDVLHPDDRASTIDAWAQACATGAPYTCDFRIRGADGVHRWFAVRATAERDATGVIRLWHGHSTNVDEAKQVQARLAASERRLALSLEASAAGAWWWDAVDDAGGWDDRCHAMYGFAPDAPRTFDAWTGAVDARDRSVVLGRIEAMRANPLDDEWRMEYRILLESGTRWLQSLGRAERDTAGRLTGMSGLNFDVTDRVRDVERAALLAEVSRLILEAPAADAALSKAVFERVREHLDADILMHYRVTSEGMRLIAGDGFSTAEQAAIEALAPSEGLCARSVRAGNTTTLGAPEISNDPDATFLHGLGAHAYACHPLMTRSGEALGTWAVVSRTRCAYDVSAVQFLQSVCHLLALAWDRQRADDLLRRNHDSFYRLIENDPFGLYVVDADFRLKQVSRGARPVFNTIAPLLERDFAEVIRLLWVEPFATEIIGRFRHTLATGEPYASPSMLERRADNGALEAYDWRIERIETPDGRHGVVCHFYDLSERQRWASDAAAREAELKSITDNTPDILSRFDRDLRHVFVNAAVERARGRSAADYLGKTHVEMGATPEVAALWTTALRGVFDTGHSRTLDHRYDSPAGVRLYATRLVPEHGASGAVSHVLAVTQDVTERERYEAALRDADRAKDEFLATLAHELRTPLAPIRTGLALLQLATPGGEAAHKARAIMERQLTHMVRLIDDLMDVSRIRNGKVELQRGRIEARAVVELALESSRPLVEAARHTLSVRLPAEPIWIDGDLTRLAQVVGNLVNNAAKYTPPGGCIEVEVERVSDASGAPEVAISVRDDGVGIAPEALQRVFELFTQIDQTLDRAQGGLGIGLSLVRRLVELHGGSVIAESAGRDAGSRFTVRLPLAADAGAHSSSAAPTTVPTDTGARRVLVVDDNVDAAETLAMLLELLSHETRCAHDGAAALAAAASFQPDLAFLDIGLPGMTGYDLARAIRADPRLARIRLVALTGRGTDDDRRQALEAGFDAHLTKPVDGDTVAATMAKLLPADGLP